MSGLFGVHPRWDMTPDGESFVIAEDQKQQPLIVMTKHQKNCWGWSCRISPRNTGALRMYKNMPLNGMPLAKDNSKKRGSDPSVQ